ncbi:MAG TPA: alpha/beta hydrolase [Lysobacter sp.]|nr:alpha/beta hydrolase [Lysobacter sp.]
MLLVTLTAATLSTQATGADQRATTASVWQPPAGATQSRLWPGAAPDMPKGPKPDEVLFEVKKVPGFFYRGISNVTDPTITVFKPARGNTGAAIVVFPGGGFRLLAIDLEGTEICDWVTSRGMTCVLLYRVPKSNHYWNPDQRRHVAPAAPFALQDAQRAIRLVRANASQWGVDPSKIGVLGMSAGGYLVAQTSNVSEPTYKPVDAADSLSSLPDFAIALYPGHLCRSGASLDPSIKVSKTTPPTFLHAAWDDPVNNICNTTVYAHALASAGSPAEVHVFAHGKHAFGLRHRDLPVAFWPSLVEKWLSAINMLPTPPADG